MKRTCEFCEYYISSNVAYEEKGLCLHEPPKYLKADFQDFDHHMAPDVTRNLTRPMFKCKYWEPRWEDDPRIKDAWDKFLFAANMMSDHSDK